MPLPKPGISEAQDEFIPRCISTIVTDPEFKLGNTPTGREQAAGMCFSQWRNKDKLSKTVNGRTMFLNHLSASIEFTDEEKRTILMPDLQTYFKNSNASPSEPGVVRLPRSTLLIGDKLYNNVWHPADELERSYMTMKNQPFIIDHRDGIEDEVGFMESPEYDPVTKKLTAIPVLNLNTAKGNAALGHIRNRLMAGKAPETSVGFWATEATEQIGQLQNAEKVTARNWEFDHNSLVTRGAGSPEMGIGIGLKRQTPPVGYGSSSDGIPTTYKEANALDEKQPPEKPKSEPEKFTMSREEFRAMMHEELAKQAEAKKVADAEAQKTSENDAMKKKLADLESKLATRTTATRDNESTTGAPVNAKTRQTRRQVIGMAVIKCARENDVHISYVNESPLPPGVV